MKKLTVGILAHVDSGKTTLSEALLYETGVISSLGRVDHKNAYLDSDSDERQRGITIHSKNARIPLKERDTELILIDTPGHVDFSPEMERCLSVLDAAILLISASSGVQAHTKTLWSLLKSYKIPTYIFVNKMDMPGTSAQEILDNIKEKLSPDAADFTNAPIHKENEAGQMLTSEIQEFYESIATSDEELLNEFLENEKIEKSHIISAIKSRKVFPVMFGSALKVEGIREFIEVFSTYLTDAQVNREKDEFAGIVYKISTDDKGKRLTFIKILAGSLKVKSLLNEEKINEIRLYSGEKYESVQEATTGEICAIVGLKNTRIGDEFGKVTLKSAVHLLPALSYAVVYPGALDKNAVLGNLSELNEEDPTLNVTHNEETGEIIVYLMGDVQAEILKNTVLQRFGWNIDFADGRVLYKETIDASFEGVGHFEPLRHYAEAHILLEPNECGRGMTYVADIPEDDLARNWQRLIYTHMTEKNHRGVLIGAPITDINLSLVSGRAHLKHTEGGDFRQATYRAIRQGLMELKAGGHCHLLEPYYDYTLEIPTELVGRAMTDINGMNGTATITENDAVTGESILCGHVPVSTMNGYSKEVLAYSKGLGKLYLSIAGYDRCHNEEEVISASSYDPDADLRNPASSVFCSHGAGTVIPWDEVPEYMHIEYGTGAEKSQSEAMDEAAQLNRKRREMDVKGTLDLAMGVEEIDRILRSSSYANANGRKGGYKGISASMHERNRNSESGIKGVSESAASNYKGAKIKEKYLLVDGYNVIHSWEELRGILNHSIDAAAEKLNDIMCNYQAITGTKLMVIYDAYRVVGRRAEEKNYNNIIVTYTGQDQTADRYIERFAHENRAKYDFTVVTSDALEQVITSGKGAAIISSREFEIIVKNTFREFNERFGINSI